MPQDINLDEVLGGALRFIGLGIIIVVATPIMLFYILFVLILDKVFRI